MNQKKDFITSTARGSHLKEVTHRQALVSRHLEESKYREASQDRLALIVQKKSRHSHHRQFFSGSRSRNWFMLNPSSLAKEEGFSMRTSRLVFNDQNIRNEADLTVQRR